MNLLEYLHDQAIIPEDKAEILLKLLEKFDENDVMYSNTISEIDLTNEEYEELFRELEKENFVDSIYIIKCPYCDTLGNTYVEKFDVPEFDECRFCHEEFNHKENYEEAFRIYFNYHKKVDILEELSQKITYNQDRIFEISEEVKELENNRKSLQNENIKFVGLRDELMYDKNESKMYKKVAEKYKNNKVKFIGTLLYMKKCVVRCSACDETFELFDIGKRFIGVCPACGFEIELVIK